MKAIGFLKKMEEGVIGQALEYGKFDKNMVDVPPSDVEKVLSYLKQGKMIFSMTYGMEDDKGRYVGPYAVYTDGEWIWPGYYSYYVGSKDVSAIPGDLFDKMGAHDFNVSPMTETEELQAKNFFWDLLIQNNPDLGKSIRRTSH